MEPRGSLGEALEAILCYGKRHISERKPHILKPEGIGGIWEVPGDPPATNWEAPGSSGTPQVGPRAAPGSDPGRPCGPHLGSRSLGPLGEPSGWSPCGGSGEPWG